MMKWVFGFLLLLNIAFFAAMRWGSMLTEDANSLGIQAALNADKISIINPIAPSAPLAVVAASAIPPTASAPLAVSAPVAISAVLPSAPPVANHTTASAIAPVLKSAPTLTSVPVPTPAHKPAQVPAPAPAPAPKPAPIPTPVPAPKPPAPSPQLSCLEWGEFSGTDLHRAEAALSAMHLQGKLKQRIVEYTSGYWVFLPPVKSNHEVESRIAHLKELAIEDYFVVKDAGVWKNAVSLGVFKTERLARNYFNKLQGLGLKYVKMEQHAKRLRFTVFDLNHLDSDTVRNIEALHQDFPDSELRKISCK